MSLAVTVFLGGAFLAVDRIIVGRLMGMAAALSTSLRTPDERPFDGASIAALERYFKVKITRHALLRRFLPMLFLNSGVVSAFGRLVTQ